MAAVLLSLTAIGCVVVVIVKKRRKEQSEDGDLADLPEGGSLG